MILDLLEDKEFVAKVRTKMAQFIPQAMTGRGMSIEKAVGMGINVMLPMILQKVVGAFGMAPPPPIPPPPPP